jgi:hypothetical protein
MKQLSLKQYTAIIRACALVMVLTILSLFLFSFTVTSRYAEDFLKQLGVSKTDADAKIVSSVLGGSLDVYGLRNAKNIVLANRAAVAKDLLVYVKKYVSTPAFAKEYHALRANEKPELRKAQTPEEMQKDMIENTKKSVADMEATIKKTNDAGTKKIFEDVLLQTKKQLKEAEDPNNKQIASYRKGYPQIAKDIEASNQRLIAEWEAKYPTNHLLFVKNRMQQFLDETSTIDFSAQLIDKNGKKIFVNKANESKGNRWKMGFRAGKEVVETARDFVQQWMNEIK